MIHISFTIHDYIELWLATANYTRSIDIHIVKMANIHNRIEEYPSSLISKSLIYNCINIIFKREKKKNEKEIEENIFHVFFSLPQLLNCNHLSNVIPQKTAMDEYDWTVKCYVTTNIP